MEKYHCYVSKEGSKYDQAVRKECEQEDHWNNVMKALSKHMGEEIKSIYLITSNLSFPSEVIDGFKEENKKLFKRGGFLKQKGKQCEELRAFFKSLLEDNDLSDYTSLRDIRFVYGMFKTSPSQHSESYRDFEGRVYQRCDFVPSGAKDSLTEISELEYQEIYTNLLKEQERRKKEA